LFLGHTLKPLKDFIPILLVMPNIVDVPASSRMVPAKQVKPKVLPEAFLVNTVDARNILLRKKRKQNYLPKQMVQQS